MHLLLVVGIALAIAVVGFALQNNAPVTVDLALWSFEGSLALVLLLAMGLGVIIAGLMSAPSMIKIRWTRSRLRSQVSRLERDKIMLERRIVELEAELEKLAPRPVQEEPERYLGLKSLFIGGPEKPKE
ncbi:MAG: LapA family protein [Nitrosospira sp.]|nr:LapA family protein [Nitrosospira sp.]MDN5882198.1 LapA family protein [Nitrosospira sp.]MDN5935843.1 LapA family protein [Nitrosospira sp.]